MYTRCRIRLYRSFPIAIGWLDFGRIVTPSNGPVVALRWRKQRGTYERSQPGPKRQDVHGAFPSSLVLDGVPRVPSVHSTRTETCMSHAAVRFTSSPSFVSRASHDDPRVDFSRRRLRLRPSHGSSATNRCTPTVRLTFVWKGRGPSVSRSLPTCFGFELLLFGSTR